MPAATVIDVCWRVILCCNYNVVELSICCLDKGHKKLSGKESSKESRILRMKRDVKQGTKCAGKSDNTEELILLPSHHDSLRTSAEAVHWQVEEDCWPEQE